MIPSLLQIPSAVSDSKLHSVLPNNGKGDFTFDRSTGATRINKDGLIEEVGYFSSELVQNGNFSELGSELVTNGDFASNIDNWAAKDCTIVWDNGKLKCDNSSGNSNGGARQNVGLQNSTTYKLVATIQILSAGSNGTFNLFTSTAAGTGQSSVYTGSTLVAGGDAVTETAYFTTGTDGDVSIQFSVGVGNAIYTIDNVSVKQVDPNSEWSLGTGFSFAEDGLKFTNLGGAVVTQNPVWYLNKTYKVTVNLSYTSGTRIILPYDGSNTSNTISVNTAGTNVTYSYTITPLANTPNLYIYGDGNATGTIHSVSVKEVLGDRPRLSYDITNGVVEDKPHLLLEPSSTNLFTFSENFTDWNGYQATSNSTTAPDGSSVLFLNFEDVRMFPTTTISSSTEYTASIYLKANKSAQVKVRNVSSADTAITLTTDWVRYEFTATSSSTSTNALLIDARFSQGLGTTGLEIALFGAQIEAQSYATSYIPTAGTTITRAAETCNNSKPSVNSTEGVLYAEIAALADDLTFRSISINDGTDNEAILIRFRTNTNRINGLIRDGGSAVNNINFDVTDIKDFHKVAYKFKTFDCALFIDGVQVATGTQSFTLSPLLSVDFDKGGNTGDFFYGKVKGLAVYNEALSESQLFQLTGVTASSIYSNFVTRTASFTVEALNEVKKVIDNL